MSTFDFSTLITDRASADVSAVFALIAKIENGTATEEEIALFNAAALRGAYNCTDLNRVTAAVEYLDETLRSYGYITGYQRLEIPHTGFSLLPDGYTEIEYIQSSGTQYIDTGFRPNQDTRVILDYQLTLLSATWQGIISARDGSNGSYGNNFSLWAASTNQYRTDFGADGGPTFGTLDTERHLADKNKALISIDGVTAQNVEATFSCNYNLHIATGFSGGVSEYPANMKLYFCKIYDSEILIRDYVPCKNESGAAGLYDIVNDVFYSNAGTGTFTAGPEVSTEIEEPDLDPYTWYESDIPTQSLMAAYLANVLSVYTALMADPALPATMEKLDYTGANQIEQALVDLEETVNVMITTFIPCGEAVCGGDNL